jgi:hypothetical protein
MLDYFPRACNATDLHVRFILIEECVKHIACREVSLVKLGSWSRWPRHVNLPRTRYNVKEMPIHKTISVRILESHVSRGP